LYPAPISSAARRVNFVGGAGATKKSGGGGAIGATQTSNNI